MQEVLTREELEKYILIIDMFNMIGINIGK